MADLSKNALKRVQERKKLWIEKLEEERDEKNRQFFIKAYAHDTLLESKLAQRLRR